MLNIASCGLNCGECAAYKATKANDTAKLSELAAKWGGDKGFTAQDMLCDGCTSDRVYRSCHGCTVRNCARDQGVKVCSQCGDYTCGKLEGLWKGYNLNTEDMKRNLAKAK